MDANSTCEELLSLVKKSGLNFSIQESPFSVAISIRKSFIKMKTSPPAACLGNVRDCRNLVDENSNLKTSIVKIETQHADLRSSNRELEVKLKKTKGDLNNALDKLKGIKEEYEEEPNPFNEKITALTSSSQAFTNHMAQKNLSMSPKPLLTAAKHYNHQNNSLYLSKSPSKIANFAPKSPPGFPFPWKGHKSTSPITHSAPSTRTTAPTPRAPPGNPLPAASLASDSFPFISKTNASSRTNPAEAKRVFGVTATDFNHEKDTNNEESVEQFIERMRTRRRKLKI